MIAIIPAREGSKRFKHKNRAFFQNCSLVEHTIQQAVKSGCFERIILSTNDKWFQQNIDQYSNLVIHDRDAQLSGDETSTEHVILNVIKAFCTSETEFCLLQPTSPLRNFVDIQDGVKCHTGASSVSVSISSPEHKFNLNKYLIYKNITPTTTIQRDKNYLKLALNGALYFGGISEFMKKPNLIKEETKYIKMPDFHLIDIDYEHELNTAKEIAKKLRIKF